MISDSEYISSKFEKIRFPAHRIRVSTVHPFEVILSHIPTHTRSNDPSVSSMSEKSVPHR